MIQRSTRLRCNVCSDRCECASDSVGFLTNNLLARLASSVPLFADKIACGIPTCHELWHQLKNLVLDHASQKLSLAEHCEQSREEGRYKHSWKNARRNHDKVYSCDLDISEEDAQTEAAIAGKFHLPEIPENAGEDDQAAAGIAAEAEGGTAEAAEGGQVQDQIQDLLGDSHDVAMNIDHMLEESGEGGNFA